jgi:uncharacterized membrane protein YccC
MKVNIPLLIAVVLGVLAVCSILSGAAYKFISQFFGGYVAGVLTVVVALVGFILYKHWGV